MAIFKDLKGKNNTLNGMRKALDYVMRLDKVKDKINIRGINCDTSNPYFSFLATKQMFNQMKGRHFKHFTLSFAKHQKVDTDVLHKVAEEFLQHKKFKGFQVLYAPHFDTDHRHLHFVVNSVNFENGKKYAHSRSELIDLINYANEISERYNLKVIENIPKNHEKVQGKSKSRGEIQAIKEGRSWKQELFLTVKDCKKNAVSKEDFISRMNEKGYQVNWTETRKHITFTSPDNKKLRNDKLYPNEQFTKEAFEKRFALNMQRATFSATNNPEPSLQFDNATKGLQILNNLDKVFGDKVEPHSKAFPLSRAELKANDIKDENAENEKGKGFDWGNDNSR